MTQYDNFLTSKNFKLAFERLKTTSRNFYKSIYYYEDLKIFGLYLDENIETVILNIKLKVFAKDAGYKLLPSGDGFFSFNDNYNMYIEILSFDKILKGSKGRNRVLFEKLNLT